ncbi:MAG: hypothetical protein ABI627_04715 [Polyangiaceae bacterium]
MAPKKRRACHFSALIGLAAALAGASACSANKGSKSGGHDGLGPAASGGNGAISINTNGNGPSDGACQHIEVNFVPKRLAYEHGHAARARGRRL